MNLTFNVFFSEGSGGMPPVPVTIYTDMGGEGAARSKNWSNGTRGNKEGFLIVRKF